MRVRESIYSIISEPERKSIFDATKRKSIFDVAGQEQAKIEKIKQMTGFTGTPPADMPQREFVRGREPGRWERFKRGVVPQYKKPLLGPEQPIEKIARYGSPVFSAMQGFIRGTFLSTPDLVYRLSGKKKPLKKALAESSPYRQAGINRFAEDVAKFAGEIITGHKMLKAAGIKLPQGKSYLARLGRHAPAWMSSGAASGFIEGMVDNNLNIDKALKNAAAKALKRGVEAAAWSGIEWGGSKVLAGLGMKVGYKKGGRLDPVKFKDAWRTVSGRLQKAGEALPEAVGPQVGAPKVRVPVQAEIVMKPLDKLLRFTKAAKRAKPEQARLRHAEMQKRAAEHARLMAKGKGEKGIFYARKALKGQLPGADLYVPPGYELTGAEQNSLFEQIRVSKKLFPFQKDNAAVGLRKLLNLQIPAQHELELLEKEFGKDLIKNILRNLPTSTKAWRATVDLLNLPRTFLTAYDLSASLRQNAIVATRHPVVWSKAFKAQLKAFINPKHAAAIDKSIRAGKWYQLAAKNGLYLPDIESQSATLAARPEEFMSRFARKFPGVKASERAFVTMGNKCRFELWSKYCNLWKGKGKKVADYKQLASYLNAVTGRGDLPGALKSKGAGLNTILFSPRYIASRLQVPYTLVSPTTRNAVRKIVAGDLACFAGVNLSILGAIKFFWGDKVQIETNPQSSDFGKITVGNVRYDPWAGFQPFMRYIAQLATGEAKSATTGKIYPQKRWETLKRFGRSKLAPLPALVVDIGTGITYVGDEMATKTIPSHLWERLIPLTVQDFADAVAYQGLGAGLVTLPAVTLGIGAVAWEPGAFQQASLIKDELARHYAGESWEKLDVVTQNLIRQKYPEIQDWERKGKAERTTIPFAEKLLTEQMKAGRAVQKKLAPELQKEMKRLFIVVTPLNRNISKDWTLNDERYKKYQKLTGRWINEAPLAFANNIKLSELVRTERWAGLDDKQKRQIIEAVIKEAKSQARKQLVLEGVKESFQKGRLKKAE